MTVELSEGRLRKDKGNGQNFVVYNFYIQYLEISNRIDVNFIGLFQRMKMFIETWS